jgi:hypothetical protein
VVFIGGVPARCQRLRRSCVVGVVLLFTDGVPLRLHRVGGLAAVNTILKLPNGTTVLNLQLFIHKVLLRYLDNSVLDCIDQLSVETKFALLIF